MTQTETLLWNRLEAFQLDETDVRLTFSQRLARENGWNLNYTLRIIDEYKKFLFLCCTSPNPVTPSDPVDQAWHLHLTYTKSYWNDLCKNTLKKEIHHNPTKGGNEEQKKFDGLYTGLKQIYFAKFGINPPPDIWHDNDKRFSDINFQRVNLSDYWMVKKPRLNSAKLCLPLIVITLASVFILASGDGIPFFFFIIGIIIAVAFSGKKDRKNKNNRTDSEGGTNFACSTFGNGDSGCNSTHSNSGSSSHFDSGCSSSGCSSGCSGCGGGCGGGD